GPRSRSKPRLPCPARQWRVAHASVPVRRGPPGAFVVLTMVLWLGLLKHRRTLAATMPPSGSLLAYFKARTRRRELSYPPWICSLVYSDLPWAYHFAWWTGCSLRRPLGLPLLPGIGVVPAGPAASPLGPFHRPCRRTTGDVLLVRCLAPGRLCAPWCRNHTAFPGKSCQSSVQISQPRGTMNAHRLSLILTLLDLTEAWPVMSN